MSLNPDLSLETRTAHYSKNLNRYKLFYSKQSNISKYRHVLHDKREEKLGSLLMSYPRLLF